MSAAEVLHEWTPSAGDRKRVGNGCHVKMCVCVWGGAVIISDWAVPPPHTHTRESHSLPSVELLSVRLFKGGTVFHRKIVSGRETDPPENHGSDHKGHVLKGAGPQRSGGLTRFKVDIWRRGGERAKGECSHAQSV